MTDLATLLAAFTKNGWWVPLDTYIHYYPSETKEAVYSRRAKEYWLDDVHCRVTKGGGLWVNLIAVNEWAAGKGVSPKGSMPGRVRGARRSE